MGSIRVIVFAFLIMLAAPAMAQAPETRFLSTLGDVPLMPGLSEVPARAAEFDKPQGRIAETTAAASDRGTSTAMINDFYARALPQLGWAQEKPGQFIRQDERLTIQTATENGLARARFSVAPR